MELVKQEANTILASFTTKVTKHGDVDLIDDFLKLRKNCVLIISSLENTVDKMHTCYEFWFVNFNQLDKSVVLSLIPKHINELETRDKEISSFKEDVVNFNIRELKGGKETLDELLKCVVKLQLKLIEMEINVFEHVKRIGNLFKSETSEENLLQSIQDLKRLIEKHQTTV